MIRFLLRLLEGLEVGIFDPDYEPDLNDYEYQQKTAEAAHERKGA